MMASTISELTSLIASIDTKTLQQAATAAILGLVIILVATGRVGSFVYGSAWWTLTLIHTVLLTFFTLLNMLWISYAILITFVTKELKYDATEFVFFSGPTALAAVSFPSAIYLNVIRWKKSKDAWVWLSMVLAWMVVFLATWIGYSLCVFSLGAIDGPYDLRHMVTLLRQRGYLPRTF